MAHHSYPSTHPHAVPPYYIATPAQMQEPVVEMSQAETAQRKRPKYTRSKTGCLTCRVKKIKCDEAKPTCQRCAQGQRDCTWPEGVPAWALAPLGKDTPETRSSTAMGFSESPTQPSARRLPARSELPSGLNLPPLRNSGQYLPPLDLAQREANRRTANYVTHPTHRRSASSGNAMSPRSEPAMYSPPATYDDSYSHTHLHAGAYNRGPQHLLLSAIYTPVPSYPSTPDNLQPFMYERNTMISSSNDHYTRYQ